MAWRRSGDEPLSEPKPQNFNWALQNTFPVHCMVLKLVITGHAAALAYHGSYGGKVLTGKVRHLLNVSIVVNDCKYVTPVRRHCSKRRTISLAKFQNLDSTTTSPECHRVSNHCQFDCFNSLFRQTSKKSLNMMSSSNGNIFCVTGPFCGEFIGHQWIPPTKANDAEFGCFHWSAGMNTVMWPGAGVTKAPFLSFSLELSILLKYLLDYFNHIHIWQVSPQETSAK